MLKRMALDISTGDELVGYGGVDLYWGPINRVVNFKSVIGYVAVDLYWRRCGREWNDRSLLGTLW